MRYVGILALNLLQSVLRDTFLLLREKDIDTRVRYHTNRFVII
jgi:hypothetical protein